MEATTMLVQSPITHVIFDFDGLLVDTEINYTLANDMMLKRYGKQFTIDLKKGQMGRKHDEAIQYLLDQTGISHLVTVPEYSKDYDSFLFEMHKKSPAKAGAERLVRHLVNSGIPTAICTGSDTKDFPVKADLHKDWVDLIPLKVLTGDDPKVQRGKPFPDGFLETMQRFPIAPASPSNVLVFEDAPNGVKAALAAGMHCVMVPDPLWRPDAEFAATITQPHVFGLPNYAA
ncbi:unnamed protein product, partial [Mesorhabditis spiculigera]